MIKEKGKISLAIQVCYQLDEDNKNREIKGLMEALTKLGLKQGLILTYNTEDELVVDNKQIMILLIYFRF